MKIRILNGHLIDYVRKGGSWDETNPDPNSFTIEVETAPIKGHYLFYIPPDADGPFLGLIDDVVLVNANIYVFVSSSRGA